MISYCVHFLTGHEFSYVINLNSALMIKTTCVLQRSKQWCNNQCIDTMLIFLQVLWCKRKCE